MAATVTKTLTTTWQLLTAEAFIGQKEIGEEVQVRNDIAVPTGDQPCHLFTMKPNFSLPKPLAGSWYGRVSHGADLDLTISEV